MSATITKAPSEAKIVDMEAPKPLPPPVTIATLFWRRSGREEDILLGALSMVSVNGAVPITLIYLCLTSQCLHYDKKDANSESKS